MQESISENTAKNICLTHSLMFRDIFTYQYHNIFEVYVHSPVGILLEEMQYARSLNSLTLESMVWIWASFD